MDRNIALEFIRVTEAAAIAASKWLGKGDKNAADQAAVNAMRSRLNDIAFSGTIVIGEGDKDDAPMLYIGEKVGKGGAIFPELDLAVDPLECTSNLANGKLDSLAVLAAGPKGTLLNAPGTYMDQIAVGKEAAGKIDIKKSARENIKIVATALRKEISETTVAILDRERHQKLIQEARAVGARVRLFEHGTIVHGLAPSIANSGIDLMIGIGGAPEAVITAAALKCLGGDMQAILKPHEQKYEEQARAMGIVDFDQVFKLNDLVKDICMFTATAISDSPILKGLVYNDDYIITHSVVMRSKTGTLRFIEAHHKIN